MIPRLGHWIRVALATFFCCIAVYESFTDGLAETSTLLWLTAAGCWVAIVAIEGARIWRRKGDDHAE